jgi:hypothetical protein
VDIGAQARRYLLHEVHGYVILEEILLELQS